jgi:methylated-DNA-[protein]-cysteine S-methyltransferase
LALGSRKKPFPGTAPFFEGKRTMQFHPSIVQCRFDSPLGPMTLAATDAGLAGAWFAGQRHMPAVLASTANASWPEQKAHPALVYTASWLRGYFAGASQPFAWPLDLSGGTAFQQAVWRVLLGIAQGATLSYGAVGKLAGSPQAMRAVGAAVGRNPVSIVVPCHRVVGASGALTGYAGGLERKTALLLLESVDAPLPAPPRKARQEGIPTV